MLLSASPRRAHAFLERASPPVGSEVAAPPRQISLTFTEGVEPLFSTIELRGADGHGDTDRQAADGTGQQSATGRRTAGAEQPDYTVIWHVTSVDTHKTEGSYPVHGQSMSAWTRAGTQPSHCCAACMSPRWCRCSARWLFVSTTCRPAGRMPSDVCAASACCVLARISAALALRRPASPGSGGKLPSSPARTV